MFGRSKEKSAGSTRVEARSATRLTGATRLTKVERTGAGPAEVAPAKVELTKEGGKGRPTPKRSEAQARNARPLVPADRKAAQRLSREAQREERAKVQSALLTGDERYLPVRDRGPQKRFVRDVVDARRNVGEYFLIIAGASLILSMVATPLGSAELLLGTTLLIYVVLAVVVVDSVLLGRKVSRAVKERFPEPERGLTSYGVTRALQIRRMRRPVPMVGRGEQPR
ncbi:hypothetical protein FHR75_002384 [Kineococcus radiotolerans]|uniref:Integral membrane protein n=1 Tax=Kineococcus radiotolerans TaxID=131568 RepID=A0A7W4TMB6_KINRA|nr:DUF3043 domain-containing protein [Kineococcus radiotolerans]MBB2901569.1 hypothetical protein [Kineococcus radiotolerans]